MSSFTASIKIIAESNLSKISKRSAASFRVMQASAKKANAAFSDLNSKTQALQATLGKLGRAGALAGLAIAAETLRSGSAFQTSLQDLSAITGSVGKQLDDMGDRALNMSRKYGIAAPTIIETNKLVASAIPALLKQPKLMAKVTEAAVLMAKASRMELGTATASLTTTLNQFNLTGEEANRVINTLAAGAKEGAAPIPYLAEAIEKAGTTFDLMGVSVEQGVAIVETIAPKFANASLAGNTLDKSFLKMRESGLGFRDGVFDVNRALDDIRTKMKDGTSITEMFGVEHAKVIEVLLQGQSEFNRYEKAVTGTDEAQLQANKNMATFRESISRLVTTVQAKLIPIFVKLEPVLTAAIDKLADLVDGIERNMPAIKAWAIALGIITGALVAFFAPIVIFNKAQQLWILIKTIGMAVKAVWAFNAALAANPIGLIVLAVVALIAVIAAIIIKWDEWGAAVSLILGPIGMVLSSLQSFKEHWGAIKASFAEGGIIEGFKTIGRVIFDSVLKPVEQLLTLIAKIPGAAKLVGPALDKISEIRSANTAEITSNLNTAQETKQNLDVNMRIDQDGRAQVTNAESSSNLNFKSETALMVPAF